MAFDINLYRLDKRDNSTLRPDGDGYSMACVLRRGSSIMTPVLEFDFESRPTSYNYCYMPHFGRYYFIEDWTYSGGLWIASCIVDVLATYKDEIGATSMYVLRSSAASDGRVPDTMYPAKEGCSYSHVEDETPWTVTNGCFIFGIITPNPTIGGVEYVAMNPTAANALLQAMNNTGFINTNNGFNTSDASVALQKSIVDPIQYIKSAVYIPLPYSYISGVALTDVRPGGIDFSFGSFAAQRIDASTGRYHTSHVFDLPKHPDASRGSYLNQAPWSLYTMTIPPFGQIELDTSILSDSTGVGAAVDVDLMTGLGILTVSAHGTILSRIEAQVGVPVQISQVSRDYIGGITAIAQGIANVGGGVAGAMTGNPAAAVSGIAGGIGSIGDAVKALTPRTQTVGSGGSYAQLRYAWRVDAQFFRPVDEDNAHNGRPLCQMRTPASLGGYMLIRDGDVATGGTSAEDARVREYLQTGFYYE